MHKTVKKITTGNMRVATLLCITAIIGGCQSNGLQASQSIKTETSSLPTAPIVSADDTWQNLYIDATELLNIGQEAMGIKLMQTAAEQGNPSAHYALAGLYARSAITIETEGISAESLKLFHLRFAAVAGHPEAQADLATLYQQGNGVQKNPDEARKYLIAASRGGVTRARYALGAIYANQKAEHYNPSEAARLWQQASESGHYQAKAQLGWLYYNGKGVRQDSKKAVQLWQEVSQQNIAIVDWGLGRYMTENDRPDYAVAAFYLKRAIQGGIREAAYFLGELYREGKGVIASDRTARELYQHAIAGTTEETNENNISRAHYWLGLFAFEGRGGSKDLALAQQNLQIAYDYGIAKALKPLAKTALQRGQKPKELLTDYFAGMNTSNPDTLKSLLQLAEQYNLNLDEYELSRQKRQAINETIALEGNNTMQRQLAQRAADNGDRDAQQKWLEILASSNDHEAAITLADLLENSDPLRALALDQTLALQNNVQGLYRLGLRFAHGRSVPKDLASAFNLLNKAARAGHTQAAFDAANILRTDENSTQYAVLIKQLLQQASKGGIAEATFILSQMNNSPEQRYALLLQANAQGHKQASVALAESRYLDPNMPWQELADYYNQNTRNALAQLRLALHDLYFSAAEDATIAFQRIQNMHKNNSFDSLSRRIALRHLGNLHTTGFAHIGLKPNRNRAEKMFAELGQVAPSEAAYGLGNLALHYGESKKAQKYYRQSGAPRALLALAHLESEASQKNILLQQAAFSGVAEAYALLKDNILEAKTVRATRNTQYSQSMGWTVWDMAVDAEHGITAPANQQQAIAWYKVAARLGMVDAFAAIGRLQFAAKENEAVSYLRKAVAFQNTDAMVTLGQLLQAQSNNNNDETAAGARALWQQAAQHDNVDGKLYTAWAYDTGFGGAEDHKKAFAQYKTLHNSDNIQASFNLANMYMVGRGTDVNVAKGLAIYEAAGNKGNAKAWMQLGKIFTDQNLEGTYDPNKAAGFLLLAAHSQYAEAWYLLGTLYDENGPLTQNTPLAYSYYQKAAYLGQTDAQYRLGLGYRYGYGGLETNALIAYSWLEIAAGQGDIAASMMRDSIIIDFKEGDQELVKDILNELRNTLHSTQQKSGTVKS